MLSVDFISNENSSCEWKFVFESDLKFSTRRDERTMALRSRLITQLNHLFSIMNDMSSDDNLSNEDVNHSISLMLAQSDIDSMKSCC